MNNANLPHCLSGCAKLQGPYVVRITKVYHKAETPLRPIVASIGSLSYGLSKYIAFLISPLAGKTCSYVKDSTDFVSLIKNLKINDDEIMLVWM